MLYEYEPNKYKAMMRWMKDVYMYQLVECEFDDVYSREYKERKKEIERRRSEMMEKFRNVVK